MARLIETVSDLQGNVVVGASVQVYAMPAATLAQTLTTDATGMFYLTAPAGTYRLVISGASIPTKTINDVELVDRLPTPTNPGDFLIADAVRAWTVGPADCGRF